MAHSVADQCVDTFDNIRVFVLPSDIVIPRRGGENQFHRSAFGRHEFSFGTFACVQFVNAFLQMTGISGRSEKMQRFMDRALLKMPIFGALIDKSCVARWTRTLSTMFAAGVPLVEALDSVGGAAGNSVYAMATDKIQQEVSTGTSLTVAMSNANVFPSMVIQMCAIGEESGSIDHMLGKAADFYEAEVDEMVAGLSSLMEPIIIVFLGTLIGGIVVSMYLPIFKLGQVV